MQLGLQWSRLSPEALSQLLNRWNSKKETKPHKYQYAHYSLENPYFISSDSLKACNKNSPTGLSQHRNQLTQSPEIVTESTTGLNHPAPLLGAQLVEENGHHSVTNSQETSMCKVTQDTSELEPISAEEAFQWTSAVDQSDFSLLNWITSTPLFNGSDLPWSSSCLQNVRKDSTVLGNHDVPQDFKGLTEQNPVCFQEQMKKSEGGCFKSETLESTFL